MLTTPVLGVLRASWHRFGQHSCYPDQELRLPSLTRTAFYTSGDLELFIVSTFVNLTVFASTAVAASEAYHVQSYPCPGDASFLCEVDLTTSGRLNGREP